jgi:hypothetical protein
LGWYVYSLLHSPRKSKHYDPRRMALDAIENSGKFHLTGSYSPGKQVIVSSSGMSRRLKSLGFDKVIASGEGTINLHGGLPPTSFYNSTYYGLEGVYEILSWKRQRDPGLAQGYAGERWKETGSG